MAGPDKKPFTRDHVITPDGADAFRVSGDAGLWPWLTLHPTDAAAVQTFNYYALVESVAARGGEETDKWTALTRLRWRCFQTGDDAPRVHHGLAEAPADPEKPDYLMTAFDADGGLVYRLSGAGIVFRNRDFKAWRKQNRDLVLATPAPDGFDYAPAAAVGALSEVASLVSLIDALGRGAGLVTRDNGFPPNHPFHDGSGDHVNATHLADAAQQIAMQNRIRAGAPARIHGGDVVFKRYVELDRPFDIAPDHATSTPDRLVLTIHQAANFCARIAFDYE